MSRNCTSGTSRIKAINNGYYYSPCLFCGC